jgi:hypothetical protein
MVRIAIDASYTEGHHLARHGIRARPDAGLYRATIYRHPATPARCALPRHTDERATLVWPRLRVSAKASLRSIQLGTICRAVAAPCLSWHPRTTATTIRTAACDCAHAWIHSTSIVIRPVSGLMGDSIMYERSVTVVNVTSGEEAACPYEPDDTITQVIEDLISDEFLFPSPTGFAILLQPGNMQIDPTQEFRTLNIGHDSRLEIAPASDDLKNITASPPVTPEPSPLHDRTTSGSDATDVDRPTSSQDLIKRPCPECGWDVLPEAFFCSNCGTAIRKVDRSAHESTGEPHSNIEELYVSKRYPYYRNKWSAMQKSGTIVSWNWAAFAFGIFWLAYRKMYLYFSVFLGAFLAEGLAEQIFNVYVVDLSDFLYLILSIVLGIASGLFGNILYRTHVNHILRDIRAKDLPERQLVFELARRGGTSLLGMAACAVAFFGCVMLLVYGTID